MTPTRPSRTVAQKMGVRPGSRAYLHDGPTSALAAMQLPELDLLGPDARAMDYLHLFVRSRDQLRAGLPALRDRLAPRGMVWVSWPKGGQLGSDLTLRSVIAIAYDLGLVESTCLRIDEVWAGLKLTRPKPGKTYANSYGTLPVSGSRPRPRWPSP